MNEKRIHAMMSLAKKELMDNVRSKWIIILSLAFVGLILLISAYGGTQTREAAQIKGYEFTMAIGSSLVVLLISIVAIMLGYNTIVAEAESKSIALLLTSALNRKDVVIGKFIGLASVLSISIVAGLGIGGLVIGFSAGFENGDIYLGFIFFSLMFGFVYLSISLLMSSWVKSNSMALAGGILLWIFFNILWDLVLFALLMASGWQMPTTPAQSVTYPSWYRYSGVMNPNSIFSMSVNALTGTGSLPEMLNVYTLAPIIILWVIVPVILAMIGFDIKDL